jgi:K(+)-stimulated pyrophosphate-energized sodium pump
MEGTRTPDYARVVGISTVSAQKELIPLATIAVLLPLLVGLVLGVEALGGFLAGVILSGQLLAVFMANGGGAWDNAKKAIEDEPSNPLMNTGKGSERHKAGVVGDTVGDPLKDTAGPALNPMIKVVNLVSLIAAPILVRYSDLGWAGWLVVILMAAGVTWGILRSKKAAPRLMAPEAAGD